MKTFLHSGDLGDIIYSLPVIKILGKGILYLDSSGGKDDPLVQWGINGRYKNTSLNSKTINLIKPLLLQQSYIEDVIEVSSINEVKVNYNLNTFRKNLVNNNLCDAHLLANNLSLDYKKFKWLTIDGNLYYPKKDVLIVRTLRVQSNHSFWENLSDELIQRAVFVGNELEYKVFQNVFKYDIPFWDLDILNLARAISGCNLFISNQTFGAAIAEGFKKNLIQEVYRVSPMAIFQREGAVYV